MLKGNINFVVNVDIHINDAEWWDEASIEECNKDAVSDELQKAIIDSIQDLLASKEDATVTIDKYTYTNLYEVKEE